MNRQLAVGDILAERYELREILVNTSPARAAYRAFDLEVEVEVALWLIGDDMFAHPQDKDAFSRSVLEMRAIGHPNLRRIFDAGRADAWLYVTGQLPTTDSLAVRLRGQQPARELDILRYAEAMCGALDAAHALGHCHGYLVPGEIVHVAGQIKVGGVGLWHFVDTERAVTSLASAARYLAPEVRAGEPPEPPSDWFSVAIILTELATGICQADATAARRALEAEQAALWAALTPAFADDPATRPRSGAELLRQVREVFIDSRVPTAQRPVAASEAASFADDEDDATIIRDGGPHGPVGFDPSFAAGIGDETTPPTAVEIPVVREIPDAMELPREVDSGEASFEISEDTTIDEPREDEHLASELDANTTMNLGRPSQMTIAPPRRLEMVSMKQADESAEPVDRPPALVERTEPVRPIVRPLSALRSDPEPASLGTLAPPRNTRSRGARYWLVLSLALAAGALVTTIVLLLAGDHDEASEEPVVADAGSPQGAPGRQELLVRPTREPCPPLMIHLEEHALCVDRFESPGEGRLPQTGLSLEDARLECRKRDLRLCTAAEWELACRGPNGSSWPYGDAHRPELCNVAGATELAGSRPECQSPAGITDMSGNVAEWVEEGQIRGGSAVDATEGRCSQRRPQPARQKAYSDVGFRCCSNALAPARSTE